MHFDLDCLDCLQLCFVLYGKCVGGGGLAAGGCGSRIARLEREASVVEAAEDVGGGVEVEVGEVVGVELEVVLVGVDAGGDAVVGFGVGVSMG
tara:strand:+ start:6338 stop:6616 length:279 start_codon:yes stop_codon:yes gene_type:complete